jgi:hypothetical protein
MDRARLLELAIAELERQRAGIDEEIAAIRAESGSTGPAARQTGFAPLVGTRRKRTPAERKAQAQRMREYWARRARAAKPAGSVKGQVAGAKVRHWTDAEKKALSAKLKEAWKKRKAASTAKKPK